jgi:hypothetical protein
MDEEEKPFDIVIIVMLLIIAIGNDVAEVFFDLLDFTGVGVVGEAIMEPANFLLDIFFTGIFVWKCGWGGGTITQYIGDLLEPFLIPGRTISVIAGIWVANNPESAIGKIGTDISSLESGKVGGELGEAENAAGTAEKIGKETEGSERSLQNETASAEGTDSRAGGSKSANEGGSEANATESESPLNKGGDNGGEEKGKDVAEREMEAQEERNPMENLQEELEEPQEEGYTSAQEKIDEQPTNNNVPTPKVVGIESRQKPQPKIINIDEGGGEEFDKAA